MAGSLDDDWTVRAHKLLQLRLEVMGESPEALGALARIQCARGDLQEAEMALRSRLALAEEEHGADSVRAGCAMRELGVLLHSVWAAERVKRAELRPPC